MELKSSDNGFVLNSDTNFYPTYPSNIGGCIYYWKLDEGSGTFFTDVIGGVGGSIFLNSGASWSGGRLDGGIYTDTTGSGSIGRMKAVISGNNSDFCSGQKTWSIWYYPIKYESGTPYVFGNMLTKFYKSSSTSGVTFSVGRMGDAAGGTFNTPTSQVLTLNNWHHLVGRYYPDPDTNVGYIDLFVDKRYAGSTFIAGSTAWLGYGATHELRMGTSLHGAWTPVAGKFDEISIFDRILSPQEIDKLYNFGYRKFNTLQTSNNQIILQGGVQ